MQVFTKTADLKKALAAAKASRKLSFVPTMGALHSGHLSLLKLASENADQTLVSIFVNPLQFNNPEDLAKYPRNIQADQEMLAKAGADYLFVPQAGEILPANRESFNYKPAFEGKFEAKYRPGHFEGVCTIVNILFDIVKPDSAVFGEKDFQQLRVIEKMLADLKLNIQIIRAKTARETDGLALSSRNARLSTDGKKSALALSRSLFAANRAYHQGLRNAEELIAAARHEVSGEKDLKLEYLSLIAEESFEEVARAEEKCRIILAAYVEGIRLIDNLPLPTPESSAPAGSHFGSLDS